MSPTSFVLLLFTSSTEAIFVTSITGTCGIVVSTQVSKESFTFAPVDFTIA